MITTMQLVVVGVVLAIVCCVPAFAYSDSYVPPSDSYVPPSDSYVPPSDFYVPPSDSYVPPSDSYAPPSDFTSDWWSAYDYTPSEFVDYPDFSGFGDFLPSFGSSWYSDFEAGQTCFNNHDSCGEGGYCDAIGGCWPCCTCASFNDAFDGVCPSCSDCTGGVEVSCASNEIVCSDYVTCAARCDGEATCPSADDEQGCFSDPPASWTCASTYYDSADGCDCNCGAYDPDCAYPGTVIGCLAGEGCNVDTGECDADTEVAKTKGAEEADYGDCTLNVDESDCNALQPYTDCNGNCFDAEFLSWHDDGYCDESDFIDLNCEAWCWDGCDCENEACETSVDAAPAAWDCAPSTYNDGSYCDCDCGAPDPDCVGVYITVENCPDSTNYHCSASDAEPPNECVLTCASDDQFTCSDKTCVDSSLKCDGVEDCADGSDELKCACATEGEYPCRSFEECIPLSQFCDGETQCLDGSDEAYCSVTANGEVSAAKVESRSLFCVGGTDPTFKTCNCRRGYLGCWDGQCLKTSAYCDGEVQCEGFNTLTDDEKHSFCEDTSYFSGAEAKIVAYVICGLAFIGFCAFAMYKLRDYVIHRGLSEEDSLARKRARNKKRFESLEDDTLWKKHGVTDHEMGEIDLSLFSNGTKKDHILHTVARAQSFMYVYGLAADVLTVYHLYNGGHPIFASVYICIWGIHVYFEVVEWMEAREIILSEDVSDAFTNLNARRYYMSKKFEYFMFFNETTAHFELVDKLALFAYMTLKFWKHVFLVVFPQVYIATIVMIDNAALRERDCELANLEISESGEPASAEDYDICVDEAAEAALFETFSIGLKIFNSCVAVLMLVIALFVWPAVKVHALHKFEHWKDLRNYVTFLIDRRVESMLDKKAGIEMDALDKKGPDDADPEPVAIAADENVVTIHAFEVPDKNNDEADQQYGGETSSAAVLPGQIDAPEEVEEAEEVEAAPAPEAEPVPAPVPETVPEAVPAEAEEVEAAPEAEPVPETVPEAEAVVTPTDEDVDVTPGEQ